MKDIKIEIKRLTDWDEVKDSTLTTIGKNHIEGKEISSGWKLKLLQSRHSPIRDLLFSIKFENLPRWLADELVRHSQGVTPKMATWRTDRGAKDRHEQRMDDKTTLKLNLNAESIINISMKRLCHCAVTDMVVLWKSVVKELEKVEPELASECVPQCIRYCGCPEMFNSSCMYFNTFYKYMSEETQDNDFCGLEPIGIKYRMEYYNKYRKGGNK